MDDLNFSHNWNGKLNCDCFTTIRLWNEKKYAVGNRLRVHLKKHYKGDAEVVAVKCITIDQINDWMAMLDTGYTAKITSDMLREMYKNKPISWERQPLAYVLIKKIKEVENDLFK